MFSYWNYKNFSNGSFCSDFINEIYINDILEGTLTGFLDAYKKAARLSCSPKREIHWGKSAPFFAVDLMKTKKHITRNAIVV